MRVFCYFVEPASYTLDLAANVYDKKKIDYCFIKSNTLVKSSSQTTKDFLESKSLISKIGYVINVFKNNDFIIVNGYNNYPFILSFILNVFSINKRFIATESDTQLTVPANFIKRLIKWIYLSIIFRNRNVLGFAGGTSSHKDLFRHYGMKEDKIFLMPLMVDNAKFYCQNKVFPNTFTFLFIGRLVKHKGVEELIKQFNSNFIDKEATLRIVGSGEQEVYLKNKYESEKVIFVGKKLNNDLMQELHLASCFVCPSMFEPWGLVVNEALSASLPVIATKDVGATFDLIKDKQTGFIANNMKDFGKKMLELYKDNVLLLEYSINAKEYMSEKWNYKLYDKCLSDAIKKVEQWRCSFFRIAFIRIASLFHLSGRSKVIFYHDIHSDKQYTDMSTPIELFKKHINIIRASGYEIVSEITKTHGQIEICFDDAFLGLYDNIEFIKEQNISIHLFVISSFLDTENHINKEQLIELNKLPQILISSHTHNHKILNKTSEIELIEELKKSKDNLESLLNKKIVSICFPEGKFNDKVIDIAKQTGYKKMYSSLPGFYANEITSGVKKRSLVQFAGEKEFKAILKGGDHILAYWYKRKHIN